MRAACQQLASTARRCSSLTIQNRCLRACTTPNFAKAAEEASSSTATNSNENYFDPEKDPDVIKAVEEGQRTRSLLIPGVMGLVTLYLGVNMLPLIGGGSVTGAVRLLWAQDPFMRKSGLSRVRLIASNSEVAATQLAKEGAVPQLVMIATTSKDEAERLAAVEALEAVARSGEAAAALAACPGTPALRAAVKKEAKANPGLAEAWKGVEKQLARPRGEEAQAAGAQAAR